MIDKSQLTAESVHQDIKECQALFEKKLLKIQNEPQLSKKASLAKKAAHYALQGSTGYYSSDVIEQVFLDIAKQHSCEKIPEEFEEKSCLHVMSRSFATGGHTRVVERWIELSNPDQKHSLLFTRKKKRDVPQRLVDAVAEKNGDIIWLDKNASDLEKGLKLREIASGFECVVLHIHMDDIIPLIAFGHEEFKRPVLFFNHADHKFWVGGSVVDITVNMREWAKDLNETRRGIKSNYFVPIAVDNVELSKDVDKQEIRQKLNLPLDKKVIMTVGSQHKYQPLLEWDMLTYVRKLVEERDDTLIVVVGPEFDHLPEWRKVSEKNDNRIMALGRMAPEKMFDYLRASDLVLDSFPMAGGTALLDAVACRIPVLSMEVPMGLLDYIMKSESYCTEYEQILSKAFTVLDDEKVAQENVASIIGELNKYNTMDVWKRQMDGLWELVKKQEHGIKIVETKKNETISDLDLYLYSENFHTKSKFNIPSVFNLSRVKKNSKVYVILTFFKVLKFRFRYS